MTLIPQKGGKSHRVSNNVTPFPTCRGEEQGQRRQSGGRPPEDDGIRHLFCRPPPPVSSSEPPSDSSHFPKRTYFPRSVVGLLLPSFPTRKVRKSRRRRGPKRNSPEKAGKPALFSSSSSSRGRDSFPVGCAREARAAGGGAKARLEGGRFFNGWRERWGTRTEKCEPSQKCFLTKQSSKEGGLKKHFSELFRRVRRYCGYTFMSPAFPHGDKIILHAGARAGGGN